MTDSPNISRNRPVRPKPYASAVPERNRPEAQEEQADGNPQNKRSAASLKVYGGSGRVRTEQPAMRGKNIDITI